MKVAIFIGLAILTGCTRTHQTKAAQEKRSASATPAAKTQPAAFFHRADGQACTKQDWLNDWPRRKANCVPDDVIAKCSRLEYKRTGDMTPADLRVLDECKRLPVDAQTAYEELGHYWMQAQCKIERENEYRYPDLLDPGVLAQCRSLGF